MGEQRCDVLVIGAGVAGLRAALELADAGRRVLVVTKDAPEDSSSAWARGGIAVALSGDEDELTLHEEDTVAAGAGLCDPSAVRILVHEGRDEVLRLIEWGARFDRSGDHFHLTREAAHSLPRILHAGGDATGREIVRALISRVKGHPEIQRWPSAMAASLSIHAQACIGADVLDADGGLHAVRAGAVIIATGGIGQCWGVTSNPPEATGDGVALGLLAGASLHDMEFVQFHPTALAVAGMPPVLLTEALRGEGAIVRNLAGRRFLSDDDPRAELAPRDVVARGIAREIARQQGRPVLLDLTGLGAEKLGARFPSVMIACQEARLDPALEPIPIRPAAHYAMGGVATDLDGRALHIEGLYAVGEAACVGVHGANRLASNSLLDGLVFGARAARAIVSSPEPAVSSHIKGEQPPPLGADPTTLPELRALADESLGIVRSGAALEQVQERLAQHVSKLMPLKPSSDARRRLSVASVALTLLSVARSALWRHESRGAHYREDYRERDDAHFSLRSSQQLTGEVTGVPIT